eukprot:NODE_2367_length_585_cov_140.301310_g2317_i0.p1 GENE.NODE_2367_length_585_cov_140.301310_g2317_i0~~NODE_2367_length_585_cov_140.301310_g2317_i0.p1  ORF type:complete len:152 (+),score=45.53 NODE_2367_length_585_cov_140.301310_g2317_i0:61-516(+)
MAPPKQTVKAGGKKGKAKPAGEKKAKTVAVRRRPVHYAVQFRRNKTLRMPKAPRYARQANPAGKTLDRFDVIKYPLTTESAMKKIEAHNTLVFIVDEKANKPMIRDAVAKMYEIKVVKINVLNRPDGLKKAYVRLREGDDSLEIANKIGIL